MDWWGLALLLLVAAPIAAVFLYLRRPSGGVPTDSLAMKGRAEKQEFAHLVGSDAGQDLVKDAANIEDSQPSKDRRA